jgi:DNA-binding NarL/FixJ family response regulator
MESGRPQFSDPKLAPKLLIASEIRLFGECLARLLDENEMISISGYCLTYDDLQGKIEQLEPDLLLLDAAFHDGIPLVRSLRRRAPRVQIVVIALAETTESVITWAEAGVAGYIPRTAALADVARTVLGISRGEQACLPTVAAGLIRRLRNLHAASEQAQDASPPPSLTQRESQIAELIGAGFSNKEIARRLNIGLSTTKSHVHNLLGKLEVRQRGQAAARVRQFSRAHWAAGALGEDHTLA